MCFCRSINNLNKTGSMITKKGHNGQIQVQIVKK